jgi:hypothetical protein
MKLTNEQIKEILDGAPDGATHVQTVDGENQYFVNDCFEFYSCESADLFDINDIVDIHALSDLAEILKLRIENEQLKAQVEQICNDESDGVNGV